MDLIILYICSLRMIVDMYKFWHMGTHFVTTLECHLNLFIHHFSYHAYDLMQTSRVIASSLNVVQTSHSYGDLMLLTKALEFKQVFICFSCYQQM